MFCCLDDYVDRHGSGSFDDMVIVLPRVSCNHRSRLVGFLNEEIVFQGRCKVPSLECMVDPRVTTHRLEVDHRFDSNWGHWCGVKRIHSLH